VEVAANPDRRQPPARELVYQNRRELDLSPSQIEAHTGLMELLIALVALIAFSLAAARWGYDSREAAPSREAWFAAHGYTWRR
jgi:hypothetical protein